MNKLLKDYIEARILNAELSIGADASGLSHEKYGAQIIICQHILKYDREWCNSDDEKIFTLKEMNDIVDIRVVQDVKYYTDIIVKQQTELNKLNKFVDGINTLLINMEFS
jgi:hypothetical protein